MTTAAAAASDAYSQLHNDERQCLWFLALFLDFRSHGYCRQNIFLVSYFHYFAYPEGGWYNNETILSTYKRYISFLCQKIKLDTGAYD